MHSITDIKMNTIVTSEIDKAYYELIRKEDKLGRKCKLGGTSQEVRCFNCGK